MTYRNWKAEVNELAKEKGLCSDSQDLNFLYEHIFDDAFYFLLPTTTQVIGDLAVHAFLDSEANKPKRGLLLTFFLNAVSSTKVT